MRSLCSTFRQGGQSGKKASWCMWHVELERGRGRGTEGPHFLHEIFACSHGQLTQRKRERTAKGRAIIPFSNGTCPQDLPLLRLPFSNVPLVTRAFPHLSSPLSPLDPKAIISFPTSLPPIVLAFFIPHPRSEKPFYRLPPFYTFSPRKGDEEKEGQVFQGKRGKNKSRGKEIIPQVFHSVMKGDFLRIKGG